jgi:hypothetical protein
MIWDDMNETPENCPASFSRNFSAGAQDQEKGDLSGLSSEDGAQGEKETKANSPCPTR